MFRFLRKDYRQNRRYYALVKELFGIVPNNIELYKLALIHRSASFRTGKRRRQINNERLEYLGDAILDAIVSDYLFIEFPYRYEGFLTQLRSKIVSRASLNDLAVRIGLDRHLSVHLKNDQIQKHIYGDALEAMIGAIYLDKGYDFTNRLIINRIFKKHVDLNRLTESETDSKSRIIEWGQKHRFTVVFDTAPARHHTDASPGFVCRVKVSATVLGEGEGPSKKEAEQYAAARSMSLIRKDKTLCERLSANDPSDDENDATD